MHLRGGRVARGGLRWSDRPEDFRTEVLGLVAEGGEPRGGVIKVVVGIAILGLVILWALRRLKRGARPDLPGAPGQ